ncbi:MAG: class I SAM-dependent methyltransferase [Aggregatilineales bacterium]
MTDALQQQIAYYRARAGEYDEWFYRKGRYDRGQVMNQRWFDEAEQVMQALHNQPKVAHVTELACGTGIWTEHLLKIGENITALDASEEMLALNAEKLQSERVTYEQADLFAWQPQPDSTDMIFFSFWLSHVPPEKLDAFLQTVATALKPGGRIFMLDSRRVDSSTAHDHIIPDAGETLTRKLNDGSEYQIYKIFYEPVALQNAFLRVGLRVAVTITPTFFIYAAGEKTSS